MTVRPTPLSAPASRTERLDRLPFTARHRSMLVGSGVGWALDAMDVGLISFLMVAVKKEWGLTTGDLSVLASIGFVGMAIGAGVGGALADRIGRRTVFAGTLVVYGIATGLSALAPSFLVLCALRFVVGLGLGAELPVASTLVSEFAPKRLRGRMVVALESFWALGWLLAAVIGFTIVPHDNGWRWAMALGLVPALYAIHVRRGLPESVRFLERAGRDDDAERIVRSFEAAAGPAQRSDSAHLDDAADTHGGAQGTTVDVETTRTSEPASPFSAPYRTRTAALWATWFGVNFAYYGAFLWIPTFLVANGFPVAKSFGFTLVITIAQLPGYAVAAVCVEKIGRRPTLALFLAGSTASALLFGQATSETTIMAAGCALSFFNLGAWGALYAITPEIYPTLMRAGGAGGATAFGRIASIVAPLVVPWVFTHHGEGWTFGVIAAAFAVATLAALALPERRGQALD
ncbi:MFS transporter [Dermacoccus nishinomiyaensis]|uniref:MFS transporter n=2 Tax=Dermacoccus nishinomiyaensis TaxID=1274 RepID=UPI0013F3DA7D|nr:MFS transporter [Dermacoccus nishinomiyaensis]MCI0154317.1 MFS transporter [Dermacoccus nishinomiyaensis]NHC32389.1 MFS transporter [Dermacoccus nishinomiyaensis]